MGRPSPGIKRVLARRGWAGEMSGLFKHPASTAQQSSLFLVRREPRASISLLWLSQPAYTISAPSFAPPTR